MVVKSKNKYKTMKARYLSESEEIQIIKDDGSLEYIPIETLEEIDVNERELGTEKIYKAPNGMHFIFYPENVLSCFFTDKEDTDEENTNIKEQIANAEFGDKFIARNGKPALFIRLIENAEYKMALFYVKDYGLVQVDRETGECLIAIVEDVSEFDIIRRMR